LGSQELADKAIGVIKPYWLERVGELTERAKAKPLEKQEILELLQYHKPDNILEFAHILQDKIFKKTTRT